MSGLDRDDAAHVEWDELAVGWALRALEPDDEARFTVHLRGCQRCEASIRGSDEVLAALVDQLPMQSPSSALRSRLLAELAETGRSPDAMPARSPDPVLPDGALVDLAEARNRTRSRRANSGHRSAFAWTKVRTLVAAAAAVLAIAGLGIWNVSLQSDRDNAASIAAARGQILTELNSAGEVNMTPLRDGDGTAVATLVRGSTQTMVMTNGLEVNDGSEQIYVLWGLRQVGDPQPIGTFDVVTAGVDMRTVGATTSRTAAFNGYGITLEPGRSAPDSPTSPIVASGQVTTA